MAPWVLIIMMVGAGIDHVEFASKQLCESARQTVLDAQKYRAELGSLSAVCVNSAPDLLEALRREAEGIPEHKEK